jgi:hypothetical protein
MERRADEEQNLDKNQNQENPRTAEYNAEQALFRCSRSFDSSHRISPSQAKPLKISIWFTILSQNDKNITFPFIFSLKSITMAVL